MSNMLPDNNTATKISNKITYLKSLLAYFRFKTPRIAFTVLNSTFQTIRTFASKLGSIVVVWEHVRLAKIENKFKYEEFLRELFTKKIQTNLKPILARLILLTSLIAPKIAYAACNDRRLFGIVPAWDQYLDHNADCSVTNFEFPDGIWLVAASAIEILMAVGGLMAVIILIYSGIKMIISQGDPNMIAEQKKTIEQAITGLAIVVIAVNIVRFVAGGF